MRRNRFDVCMDILELLRRTNGLNADKIISKAGTESNKLDIYLRFLESENLIGSRPPEKGEAYSSRTKQIYFLRQEAYQFMRDLNRFKIKFNIDDLEKQLQAIR